MQIDEIINKINTKSIFKIVAFLVLSFTSYQNFSQLQSILVASVVPTHKCQLTNPVGNVTVSKDQCTITINGTTEKCHKWIFSPDPVGKTMISDFELVCDRKKYVEIILILWYSTSVTGIFAAWLSDKYGRKKVLIFNVCLETVSSILVAVSPNVIANIISRFLLGISASTIYVAFVWLIESVNIEFREFIGSFFWLFGCIAYTNLPLIVYLTKNWRYTQIFSIIPSVLYIFIILLPESPRWLMVVGKKEEAFVSLNRISKINKLKINFNYENVIVVSEKTGDLKTALAKPWFMFCSALTFFLQFTTFLFYLGVNINLTILSHNIFISMFLMGVMEIPGLLISYFSLRYLRRKVSLMIFSFIGSSTFWISVFFKREIAWQLVVRICLGCLAKAFIASINQTSMVYVAELFPTSHRSFGFVCVQIASFLAFVGAIYINKLAKLFFFLPMTIYLILLWTSCITVFCLLPETKGLPIPETIDDQRELRIGNEEKYVYYMQNKMSMNDVIPEGEIVKHNESTPN